MSHAPKVPYFFFFAGIVWGLLTNSNSGNFFFFFSFTPKKKNSQIFEILDGFFFFPPGKVYTVLTNSNLRAEKKKTAPEKKKTTFLLTNSIFPKKCAILNYSGKKKNTVPLPRGRKSNFGRKIESSFFDPKWPKIDPRGSLGVENRILVEKLKVHFSTQNDLKSTLGGP